MAVTFSNGTVTDAAVGLHRHIVSKHWNGRAVAGPDPGIRYNARIGRFIKSYLDFLPWSDTLTYVQAQKYWIMSNWLLAEAGMPDSQQCQDVAVACSDYLLSSQQPGGHWEYPNPEWKGRIATVEGNYGAMALLESYQRTGDDRYLGGARKWYEYAVEEIGFQDRDGLLAINYFRKRGNVMVPNVSASALRTFAMLARAARDDRYLEHCGSMVAWLNNVQLASGELPYLVLGPLSQLKEPRLHFLCYQYNAFELLNLATYFQLTGDSRIVPVLENLAEFVSEGVSGSGACWYDCHHQKPEVLYYGMAAGAALSQATELGFGDYRDAVGRAYQRVVGQQRSDGSTAFYSRRNYGLLSDRRSYPRYLSMILYHLLLEHQRLGAVPARAPAVGAMG